MRRFVKALVYLIYYNIPLLILAGEIYQHIIPLTILVLDQIVVLADVMIRPATPRENLDTSTKLVGLLLLLHPFFIVLLFYEKILLITCLFPFLHTDLISYLGIGIYIVGGITVIVSRIRLGRYGDGTVQLKEDHHLMTDGIYNHIRHPLYLGGFLGRVGIGLTFTAYFGMILFVSVYFIIFRMRMEIEEQSLIAEFGEEYEEYMKRTRRLLPYIY